MTTANKDRGAARVPVESRQARRNDEGPGLRLPSQIDLQRESLLLKKAGKDGGVAKLDYAPQTLGGVL